jgi:hypothetical protein
MTEAKFGQKRVRAAEVRRYDRIVRKADDGGELMMLAHDLGFGVRDGQSFISFTGPTATIDPGKLGEQMTGAEMGEDTWEFLLGAIVLKLVPIEEAEFG